MQQFLEMLLTGRIRLPLLGDPELLALERELPRSDWLALLMLERRGEATMSGLAADLGAPLSTATGIGTRLERRGFVLRERHPGDRRVVILRLTPKGQQLARRARAKIDSLLRRVQEALAPEEVDQLLHLVQKVVRALQEPADASPTDPSAPRRIPVD